MWFLSVSRLSSPLYPNVCLPLRRRLARCHGRTRSPTHRRAVFLVLGLLRFDFLSPHPLELNSPVHATHFCLIPMQTL